MNTETSTADRRELVARTLWSEDTRDQLKVYTAAEREAYCAKADAVLAALEPWLLPDLPQNVSRIDAIRGDHPESPWEVTLEVSNWIDAAGDYYAGEAVFADGPTFPAAIRAALEGAE